MLLWSFLEHDDNNRFDGCDLSINAQKCVSDGVTMLSTYSLMDCRYIKFSSRLRKCNAVAVAKRYIAAQWDEPSEVVDDIDYDFTGEFTMMFYE